MTIIFQYGSNLDTERLNSRPRLRGDARYLGLARTLEPHQLSFTVWSEGNRCAAADLVPDSGRRIWGALYEVPDDLIRRETAGTRPSMDSIENEGVEYRRTLIRVEPATPDVAATEALTWLVQHRREGLRTAFHYVRHILAGLLASNAPPDYLAYVRERILTNNPALQAQVDGFLKAQDACRKGHGPR